MSDQPMENLPCFQNQISDTYTSTYVTTYKNPAIKDKLVTNVCSKAPQCADYIIEPLYKTNPSASKWASTSNITYGNHQNTPAVERAAQKIESVMVNTNALEEPMQTVEPLPDSSTSRYVHAPMPDAAISQHFVARKTTSALIDGSGATQIVDVPQDTYDPAFYYLREGDGTRRFLEVRCPNNPVPLRAQGRNYDESAKEIRTAAFPPAVTHLGLTSSYRSCFNDPRGNVDAIEMRADELRKGPHSNPSIPYGETRRICVPHFFKHEMGVPTTDRTVELKQRHRERDANPPRAAVCSADKIMYNSAPDDLRR